MKSKIGQIIDEKGIKRKWVAEQLGVSAKQVSNWVTGYSYPTVDKAFKLAKILNVKVDDLYKEEEEN